MTVSSSFDYSRTGTQVIAAALRKLGVLAEGQAPTTTQTADALEALNLMLKAWIQKGLDVKQIRTLYVYPDEGLNELEIGVASTDHEASLELGITKLTDNAASGATTLTVSITAANDVVGTSANSDVLGIELNNGNIHWTTISSGGATATLVAAAATTGAANSTNRVYYFTTRAQRPEQVLDVYLIRAADGSRQEITETPESTMLGLSQVEEGDTIHWAYSQRLDEGILRIWPRWPDGKTYLEARIVHAYDDMDAASDTFAFNNTAYEALVYGLAISLAPEYKLPMQERILLKQEAEAIITEMFDGLTEGTSIYLQPDTRNG